MLIACAMASSARVRFERLFRTACKQRRSAIIGMVHVQALPGTPRSSVGVGELADWAVREARVYQECGLDGVLVENMHDVPYLRGHVGPEVTSCMARVCCEVRQALGGDTALGVQILAGANREAVAVAKAAGADFVRVEGFVFSHVADEGWIDSCAGELLRYRKNIGAEDVLLFTDIKKKHSSHVVTGDVNVSEMARAAEFFSSDGVIVTGPSTSAPADKTELAHIRSATPLPLLVGSGVTSENVNSYLAAADALIVGSWFKEGGLWYNPVNRNRVSNLMNIVNSGPQY